MARFEPEGFVTTLDPARVAALLRQLQRGEPEPALGEPPPDDDAPTVRPQAQHEYV